MQVRSDSVGSVAVAAGGGRFPAYFDERVETMPRADIAALQEARLRLLLRHAYEHAPLIRQVWQAAGVSPSDIRSLDDFAAKAPFTSKDHVRAFRDQGGDPFGGMNSADPHYLKGVTFTSGTTGDPTPVLRGGRSISEICTMRDSWMLGARPGDYVTVVRPTFRVGHVNRHYQEAGLIPILFKHAPAILPDFFRAARLYRPSLHYFLSTPLLIAMEEYFEKTGTDPRAIFEGCHGATVGGEPLSPRRLEVVRSWGLDLFEVSGLGESLTLVECPAHDGMHAWEDQALIECLDVRDDSPVADGEVGELVVTVLNDPFQPMVRYRTDDLVTVARGPCACGRTHARIRIVGRKSDQTFVAGKPVMPRDLQLAIEGQRASRAGLFQIIRFADEMDTLRIRIGYDPAALAGTIEAHGEALRDALETAVGVPVEVLLTPDAELLKLGPPHKIPRVAKA